MEKVLTHLTLILCVLMTGSPQTTYACTGINLTAENGAVIVSRTDEWGANDMDTKLAVFPSNHRFVGLTRDGLNGAEWQGKFGFVGMSAYNQPYVVDGLNEKGLAVGMFFLAGFADYADYDPSDTSNTVSVGDWSLWMLSQFSSVAQVRANIDKMKVVAVADERFGGVVLPFHWRVSDPSGENIVIEITNKGTVKIFDSPSGVIANGPTYDWHQTNLQNYLTRSRVPAATKQSSATMLTAESGGLRMNDIPGDFSSPSRFIRASFLAATARPLATAADAVSESFRLLNSFDIPSGAVTLPGNLPKE